MRLSRLLIVALAVAAQAAPANDIRAKASSGGVARTAPSSGASRRLAGSLSSPAALGGLIAYYRADTGTYQASTCTTAAAATNDPVGCWQDQSGNGYNLVQATDGARPVLTLNALGGLPAITWTVAGTQWLKNADFGRTYSQPNTIIIVGKLGSDKSKYFYDGATNNTSVLRGSVGQTVYSFYAGSNVDGSIASDTNYHVHTVVFNGASSTHRIDQVADGSGNAGAGALAGFTLGGRADGGSGVQADGAAVTEVYIFNAALPDYQIQQAENLLKARYGL